MDSKSMIGAIIGITIATLVVAVLLIPIVSESVQTEDTYTNTGYYVESVDADVVIKWNYATPTVLTVGTETVDISNLANDDYVAFGDKFVVSLNTVNTRCSFYGSGTFVTADSTYNELTLTYSSGSLTATNGNTSKTISDVNMYVVATTSDLIVKNADSVAMVEKDSELYAVQQIYSGNFYIDYVGGTINDMTYPASSSNGTVNAIADSTHIDTYKLTSIVYEKTYGANDKIITMAKIVVPASITVEKTIHLDNTEISLINVIPLLVIIGILMMCVFLFVSKR